MDYTYCNLPDRIIKYNVYEQDISLTYDVSGDGTDPGISNAYPSGQETRYFHEDNNYQYSYTFSSIYIEVADPGLSFLFLERFYRVEGIDMYARKTASTVMSVKYCKFNVYFQFYNNPTYVTLIGHVVSQISANRYKIKLYIPSDIIKAIGNPPNNGSDTIINIVAVDLNNRQSPFYNPSILINFQYQEYHGNN